MRHPSRSNDWLWRSEFLVPSSASLRRSWWCLPLKPQLERSSQMKHLLIVAAMATAGSILLPNDAFAFHRHHKRCCTPQPTCCAPAPSCCTATPSCAPGPASTTPTPQPDAAPAPPPQAGNANGYQSYSYEPGASIPPAPTPIMVPQRAARQPRSFYDEIRADRKVRGTLSQ